MADATTAAPAPRPRKRHHWFRVLAWTLCILIALLVTFYFVFTSTAFLKKRILPRVSNAIHANVTVSSAVIHPSEIILRDLKIQPTNQPALVTAPEVHVKYSLFDLIGGNIHVDQMTLVSPLFQIVQNADGTSNLDPLTKAQKKAAEQKPKQPGQPPSKPTQLDLRKLKITDGTFRDVQNHKGGTRDLTEITNLNLTVTDVRNGGAGKLEFNAVIRDENNPPAPAMYGLLLATTSGTFNFTLTPDLKPGSIQGDARFNILQAAGSFTDFGKLDGTLHCDASPTELKTVSLSFEKEGMRLGELRAAGPFDAQKSEGRLSVELLSVDQRVLNLFAAKSGFDFGSTTITSTNEINVAKAGAEITAAGQLSASKFQLSRTNESTPPLELRADYNISVDKIRKTALLQALNVTGTQEDRPLLRAELTSPMTLAWGNTTNAVGDSSFNLAVTKLNIADWRMFTGSLASGGMLDLRIKLLSQKGGEQLTFDATNRVQGLTTQIGDQHLSDLTVVLAARGKAADFKQFNLSDYNLQVVQSNQTALAISGSGTYDRASRSADLQMALQATLSRVLRLLNWPDASANSGTLQLKGRVTQEGATQTVTGNLSLAKFNGKFGKNEFKNFGAAADLDVDKEPDEIDIHKLNGTLTQNRNPAGGFELSGIYGLKKQATRLEVKLSDFNQDGLRPFLEPLLADKKLVSISINGTASAQMEPNGSSAIKGDLEVTNLVVSDPMQKLPSTPLDAKLQVDAAFAKKVADVRQFEIALTPTQRATNDLQFRGRVDMSHSNAIAGNLKLSADSLDLTSFYDLLTATNKTTTRSNSKGKPQSTPAAPPPVAGETATNHLPFTNFTVDASVRELYFRDIAATNFEASVKLDGSHVVLKPFRVTLEGAPMFATVDVDMSVPGYKYILSWQMTNVPTAPLWNTVHPEEKGTLGGTFTTYADISGTGTSGESLQKTLTGNFHVGATNLNLNVTTIHSRMLRGVIDIVATIPDLAQNVFSIGSFGGGVATGKLNGSLSRDLEKSPIDVITTDGIATNGQVNVNAVVRSAAFEATVNKGTITLAPELTNSTIDIPIGIALNSGIIDRFPLLIPFVVSTSGNYSRLADFFSEKGTIGEPRKDISSVAFAKSEIKKFIPELGGTNGVLSNALQRLGGLTNSGTNTNQPVTTNQPPPNTNKPPSNTMLNRFLGK